MATALKTSSQISGLLKQLLTLMYIPAEHATDVLCYIEAQCTDDNFLNLVAYMRHTWFGLWQPKDWSQFMITVRTNNDVEGWHHKVNDR